MKLFHLAGRALIIPLMLFSLGTSAFAAKKEKQTETVIPLEKSEDGLFTLRINVNERDNIPVILDTAAGMSALNRSSISKLGLTKFGTGRLVHGLIGKEISDTVKVDLFSAGALEQSGPVLVIDDPDAIADKNVEGLIGMDLLASNADEHRYLLLNFFDQNIVTANSLGAFGKRQQFRGMKWTKLKHLDDDFNFLSFPVKVSGISATAIIDTGIKFTVINQPLADKLQRRGRMIENHIYTDINGEQETMRHLIIGKVRNNQIWWGRARALIFDPPAIERLGLAEEPSVLLGLNYLYNLALVIDRKTQKIAFMSDAELTQPTHTCSASRLSCFGSSTYTYRQ